jgi:hypothetical protein
MAAESSPTFAPTSNDRAVPTRSFVPQSSCGLRINSNRCPTRDCRTKPYLRPEILGHFFHYRPICLPLLFACYRSFTQKILFRRARGILGILRLLDWRRRGGRMVGTRRLLL